VDEFGQQVQVSEQHGSGAQFDSGTGHTLGSPGIGRNVQERRREHWRRIQAEGQGQHQQRFPERTYEGPGNEGL
jgi:hypothetical protein